MGHTKNYTLAENSLSLSSQKSSLPRRESGSFSSVAPARSPSSLQAQQKKKKRVSFFPPRTDYCVRRSRGPVAHAPSAIDLRSENWPSHTHTHTLLQLLLHSRNDLPSKSSPRKPRGEEKTPQISLTGTTLELAGSFRLDDDDASEAVPAPPGSTDLVQHY